VNTVTDSPRRSAEEKSGAGQGTGFFQVWASLNFSGSLPAKEKRTNPKAVTKLSLNTTTGANGPDSDRSAVFHTT
jgi:hypothetical protein